MRYLIFKDYEQAMRFAELYEINLFLQNKQNISKNNMIYEYANEVHS